MIAAELRRLRAFFLRDLQMALSYPLDFAMRIGTLAFQLVLLYFLSLLVGSKESLNRFGGYLPFTAVGLATMGYFQAGFTTFSSAIRSEQMTGTLEALLMTPTCIPSFIVGSALWSFSWTTITALLYLGGSALIYDFELKGNLFLVLGLLFLLTLFFVSLGTISASFVMVYKRGDPLGFIVGMFSALLGGVFFPVTIMKPWLQTVSNYIPLRHGLDGLRAILLEGQTFAQTWPQFRALIAFNIVLIPLSLYIFQRALRRARREGTLLQY